MRADLSCAVTSSGGPGGDCNGYEHYVGNFTSTPPTATEVSALLLDFDVASQIPPGAEVTSAKLVLNVRTFPTAQSGLEPNEWKGSFGIHRMEQPWTHDASWGTSDGTTPWPNGLAPDAANDYAAADETVVLGPDLTQYAYTPTPEWDVTATVRDWVTNAEPNHGLILVDPDVPNVHSVSFEGASVINSDPPYLYVNYTLPCPSDPYAAAQGAAASTVYAWNEVLLDMFRFARKPPTVLGRAAAMMNVGIYDTFNSVYFAKLADEATGTPTNETCGWEPFQVLAETPANTDANLAAGIAAREILTTVFPDTELVDIVEEAFDDMYDAPYQEAAEDLGEFIAEEVIASRTDDGSAGDMSYTEEDETPGAWRKTPDESPVNVGRCNGPATPGWGLVTPFVMDSSSQYRQQFPGGFSSYASLLTSAFYAREFNEVKEVGSVDSELNLDRTADQTELAWFWANDLYGTYKPPGQLLAHTRIVAEQQPAAATSGDPEDFFREWTQQGIRVARLYAAVSLALADAGIAAWDMKYQMPIDLWRPISAIRHASTDGNLATMEDDDWEPLLRDPDDLHFSPCFPAWVSGHATFGGAWSRVMENEFRSTDHTDPFPLTLTTEDPHSELPYLGSNTGVFQSRTFDSFAEAGAENANSRLYLGVHYRMDSVNGLTAGTYVGDHQDSIGTGALRWLKTCPNWSCAEEIS